MSRRGQPSRSDVPYLTSGLSEIWLSAASDCGISIPEIEKAYAAFTALLDALDMALDEEDRLECLLKHCFTNGVLISRKFYGVDLVTHPRNRPLLHHCAAAGYQSCIVALINSGFVSAEPLAKGSHSCNALHLAAWGGHLQCVELLCRIEPNLARAANRWNEFPELAAFKRACEVELTVSPDEEEGGTLGQLDPACFVHCAVACLRTRLGDMSLDVQWFRDQARAELDQFMQDSSRLVTIPHGTSLDDIVRAVGRLTERARLVTLSANGSMLQGKAAHILLDTVVKCRYLQNLTLKACGLCGEDLSHVRRFLMDSQVPLDKLDLSCNNFRDAVIDIFCRDLLRIKDLCLDSTGFSLVGLRSFAELMGKHLPNDYVRLDTLRLVDNDLSELGVASPLIFADFIGLLENKNCTLRQVFLDKTRLQISQLELLVAALPNMSLTRLSCHQLSFPLPWCKSPSGKLYCALNDQRCQMKKFGVDQGQSSEMHDQLWKAIKLRDVGLTKGKGQGRTNGPLNLCEVRIGNAVSQAEVLGGTFDFSVPFCAVVQTKAWDVRRCHWRVDFVTPKFGGVVGVAVSPNHANEIELGQFVEITLCLRRAPEAVDRNRQATDVALNTIISKRVSQVSCLDCCRLVMVRESTQEVLLLRSRLSHCALCVQGLANNAFQHMLEASGLPDELKPHLKSLLSGLSDLELKGLLDASKSDYFPEPFATQDKTFVHAPAAAKHRALVSSQCWSEFIVLAQGESNERSRSESKIPDQFHRMLTSRWTCQPSSGVSSSNLMESMDPFQSFLDELHRNVVRPDHRLVLDPTANAPASLDVPSDRGHLLQRLYLCVLPEDVVCGEHRLTWLRPTQNCEVRWVLASDVKQLAYLLNDDRSEGYSALPGMISRLASQVGTGGSLRCVKVAV